MMTTIYDITQELFTGKIYPGDPAPTMTKISSIANGDDYNLSTVNLCVHNATHIDAPSHFINNGKNIDEIPLGKCIGPAVVVEVHGLVNEENMMLALKDHPVRILFKNSGELTREAAELAVREGVQLIGTELQTVGDHDVHRELLRNEIVLLEGIVLQEVQPGKYFLFAAPLKWGAAEGAPCRAVLLSE